MQRWTRLAAVITAIGLTTAVFGIAESAASGDRRGGGETSDDGSLSQGFKRSTNGTATEFSNAVRELEVQVGFDSGNGTITAAEVGAANYQKLVRQIAAIGDAFDPVLVSSDAIDAELGSWTVGVYALRDDDNPRSIPIGNPIVSLIIAAALVFLPTVFS